MFLHIIPLYAAAFGLFYVALSAYVVAGRYKNRVLLGTGDSDDMLQRVRVHGNFAEYVPFALLLLAFAEGQGTDTVVLHALCVLLAVSRLAHIAGIRRGKPNLFRAAGMVGTFTVFTATALLILI